MQCLSSRGAIGVCGIEAVGGVSLIINGFAPPACVAIGKNPRQLAIAKTINFNGPFTDKFTGKFTDKFIFFILLSPKRQARRALLTEFTVSYKRIIWHILFLIGTFRLLDYFSDSDCFIQRKYSAKVFSNPNGRLSPSVMS